MSVDVGGVLVGRTQGDRDRLHVAVGSLHGERHGLARQRLELGVQARVREELDLLAVDPEDRITGLEPGHR